MVGVGVFGSLVGGGTVEVLGDTGEDGTLSICSDPLDQLLVHMPSAAWLEYIQACVLGTSCLDNR